MKKEEIKYEYHVGSSIDFGEIFDKIVKSLGSEKGVIEYFSFDRDKNIEEIMPVDDLKSMAMEIYGQSTDLGFYIKFPEIEMAVNDEFINILSKVKLDLSEFDDVEVDDKPLSLNLGSVGEAFLGR